MLTRGLNGTWTLHAEAALQHSAKRVPNPCHGHVKKNSLQIVLQTGLDCRWLSVCLGGTPPPSSNPACMNETRADSIQHGACATHCVCGISQLGSVLSCQARFEANGAIPPTLQPTAVCRNSSGTATCNSMGEERIPKRL